MDDYWLVAVGAPESVEHALDLPRLVAVERDSQNAVRRKPAKSILKTLERIDVIVETKTGHRGEGCVAINCAEYNHVVVVVVWITKKGTSIGDMRSHQPRGVRFFRMVAFADVDDFGVDLNSINGLYAISKSSRDVISCSSAQHQNFIEARTEDSVRNVVVIRQLVLDVGREGADKLRVVIVSAFHSIVIQRHSVAERVIRSILAADCNRGDLYAVIRRPQHRLRGEQERE